MKQTPWLMREQGTARRLRLYCFSYAGGGAASFISWQAALGRDIEVCSIQLPGRGIRMNEPPYTSMPLLIPKLAQVIAEDRKLPFAFFGHSLGGLISFELARYCRHHHLPMPEHLFVSGCAAPQDRMPPKNMYLLPDDELIEELKKYGGTPPQVLDNRELMELVLPTIRADFSLVENYKYSPMPLLTMPITVLAGKSDEHVSVIQAEGWAKETTASCAVQWFEGDHFFIEAEQRSVLDFLSAKLADIQFASA